MQENEINVSINDTKLTQTEIVVVLDRSGSMWSRIDPTVEGFNKFLNEQQNSEGEAFITLVQFDDRYEMNYKSIPIKDAKPLVANETYIPRGGTALLDAIGKTINDLETDRDVIFTIITDGEENSSREFKPEAIKNMIETIEKEKGWKFLYLGANQDAITVASSFGIPYQNSMNYNADNNNSIGNTYVAFSANISNYRNKKFSSRGIVDVDMEVLNQDLNFTDNQRKDAK